LKRSVVLFAVVILALIAIGCATNQQEKRLVTASTVLPMEVTFKNEWLDLDGPARRIVNSTITVNIQDPEKFISEVVTDVIGKFTTNEINEIASRPFIDLGFPKHDMKIPDSLQFELNAWLLATAGTALQAKGIFDNLSQFTSIEDEVTFGSEPTKSANQSVSTTVPTEYGEVIIDITYDYENAPKGMVEGI